MKSVSRKKKNWEEAERLMQKIPYMWEDFAIAIASHNTDFLPEQRITDEFLNRVIKQGEKMKATNNNEQTMKHLKSKHNGKAKLKELRELMGEELFSEMLSKGLTWGYYAILYRKIYEE